MHASMVLKCDLAEVESKYTGSVGYNVGGRFITAQELIILLDQHQV
jgi:hypothetical protein